MAAGGGISISGGVAWRQRRRSGGGMQRQHTAHQRHGIMAARWHKHLCISE